LCQSRELFISPGSIAQKGIARSYRTPQLVYRIRICVDEGLQDLLVELEPFLGIDGVTHCQVGSYQGLGVPTAPRQQATGSLYLSLLF